MNFANLNPLNWFKKPAQSHEPAAPKGQSNWSPLLSGYGPGVNLLESDNRYHIELAVPGLTQEDLNIELEGNQLIISGAQSRQRSIDVDGQQWSIARAGFFQRRFTLPADAAASTLEAQLKYGVLTLKVARTGGARPERRTITIH